MADTDKQLALSVDPCWVHGPRTDTEIGMKDWLAEIADYVQKNPILFGVQQPELPRAEAEIIAARTADKLMQERRGFSAPADRK